MVEVVALAGALADAGEDREAAVVHGDVVDELLDHDGLADARAAEEAGLAALRVGLEQVDDLDARLEHLDRGRLLVVGGRLAVDRPAVLGLHGAEPVHRVADDVQDPAERFAAHGHRDRRAEVHRLHAAHHAVGRLHGDAPDDTLAELLRDLDDDVDRLAGVLAVVLDLDGVVDGRKLARRKLDVEDRPDDRDDLADVLLCHGLPLFAYSSAAAPETISISSLVMRA